MQEAIQGQRLERGTCLLEHLADTVAGRVMLWLGFHWLRLSVSWGVRCCPFPWILVKTLCSPFSTAADFGASGSCRIAQNNPNACHLLGNGFAVFMLLTLHTKRLEQLVSGVQCDTWPRPLGN